MAGDSEDDCDHYDCSDDIDDAYAYDDEDDDESLSDSFSDYETDNNCNWRVERLQKEEYLAVCWFTLLLYNTCIMCTYSDMYMYVH